MARSKKSRRPSNSTRRTRLATPALERCSRRRIVRPRPKPRSRKLSRLTRNRSRLSSDWQISIGRPERKTKLRRRWRAAQKLDPDNSLTNRMLALFQIAIGEPAKAEPYLAEAGRGREKHQRPNRPRGLLHRLRSIQGCRPGPPTPGVSQGDAKHGRSSPGQARFSRGPPAGSAQATRRAPVTRAQQR